MPSENLPRKLAAILYADVVGYSRLMSEDERATVETLNAYFDIFSRHISSHGGRIVDTAGDSILALFDSIVETLQCAVEVHEKIGACNEDLAVDRRMRFRMGVNLGDVMEDGTRIYGDGVNIAARLESLADPGGICVSEAVRYATRGKLDLQFEDMGAQALKNIKEPVKAYRVVDSEKIVKTRGEVGALVTPFMHDFSLPVRPSIAILPFTSMGSEPDQDGVAEGIRFGIQATLVQLSGLFLVNAPKMNTYRGKDVPAASAGVDLNVGYVLEGAVQRAGNRIRATVQLTDVKAKRTIWAERYDRVLDDVFALQDEITGEVISALNIKLQFGDIGRGWFSMITDPQARACYHQGSSHLYQGTKQDNAAAREMFKELYRLQPDSIIGPSNISVTHWLDAFFDWSDDPAGSIEHAAEWARIAVEYEDNNGIGHAVLGHLELREGNHEEALALCRKGVELRSSCPLAHGLLGLVLNYCGDPHAAVREVRMALDLERVYPTWLIDVLASAYRDCGELDLSISAAAESIRLDPHKNDARLILCSDYKLAADDGQAAHVAREVTNSDPGFRLSAYAQTQPYVDTETLDRVIGALRDAGLPD